MVILSLAFLLGVLASSLLPLNLHFISTGAVILWLLAAVLFYFVHRDFWGRTILLAGFFFLGVWRYSVSLPQVDTGWIQFYNGQEVRLEGRLVDPPEFSATGQKLILGDLKINGEAVSGKVLVYAASYPQRSYGEWLEVKGKLEEPPIFDDFSYKDYLARQGIYSVVRSVKMREIGESRGIRSKLLSFRREFEQRLGMILPEPHATLAVGTLLGVKRGFSAGFSEKLRQSGVIHVVVVSGTNVSILLAILLSMAYFIPVKALFPLGFILTLFYTGLTGFSYPVVRAALTGLIVLLAKVLGRQKDALTALFLSAGLICLHNPQSLGDASFQLSFLATSGILFINPWLARRWQFLPARLREAVTTTLASQIAVSPVTIFSFRQISLIAPVANVLVFWVVPLIMLTSAVAGVGGWMYLPLGRVLAWPAWLFLEYFVRVVEVLGRVPVLEV